MIDILERQFDLSASTCVCLCDARRQAAMALAESEYKKYRVVQDRILESDFDREVKKLFHRQKKRSKK